MHVPIFLLVDSIQGAFTRSLGVDEAGAGTAIKNTAHCTMIRLQVFVVQMQRILTATVVQRNQASRRRTTVVADTVVIALRGGRVGSPIHGVKRTEGIHCTCPCASCYKDTQFTPLITDLNPVSSRGTQIKFL
jgi:hypothetical protein